MGSEMCIRDRDMGAHRLSGAGDFLLAQGGRAVRFTGPVLTVEQLGTLPAVIDGHFVTAPAESPLYAPQHVGWVLAETWRNDSTIPGRERIRQTLGLGASAKAAALQAYCREVWAVMWPEDQNDETEVIDNEG